MNVTFLACNIGFSYLVLVILLSFVPIWKLRKVNIHLFQEEDACVCKTCLEKIDKMHEFKKKLLNSEKYKKKDSAEDSNSCQVCRSPTEVDAASFFAFLENNNVQTFFGSHFPEIVSIVY